MPLTDEEKQKIQDIELFRNEIREQLHPEPRDGRISRFFRHQAILLILGCFFTAGIGSWLTFYWKVREWHNEQSYLKQQRALDKKYEVIQETFSKVAVTTTAAEDILAIYYGMVWSPKDISERRDNWHKTSREWRVDSKVLSENIAVTFTNPDIGTFFQQIINTRKQLGNMITNLPTGKISPRSANDVKTEAEQANLLANKVIDLLHKCGKLMIAETANIPAH